MIVAMKETLTKYSMLSVGDHVIIGLSGGADSVALFYGLLEVSNIYGLTLTAVHVNHGLRGEEALRDQVFVEQLCKNNKIALDTYEYDVYQEAINKKITTEEAGRLLRYASFSQSLIKRGADKIAVAHNMNDNCETMLMNFFRGTGLKGLGAIPPVRGEIIRPLINVNKTEILSWCSHNNFAYVTDSTNSESIYMRNKIRLEIIPFIEKEINSRVVENMGHMSVMFSEEDQYIQAQAVLAYNASGGDLDNVISIDKLKAYPGVIQKRVIRIALSKTTEHLKDISRKHIYDIVSLLDKQSGKTVELPYGVVVYREYDSLIFSTKTNEIRGFCYDLVIDEKKYIPELDIYALISRKKFDINEDKLYTKLFHCDKLIPSLQIRSRRAGDKIFIASMGGNKKIQDYFSDSKLPKNQRDCVGLLAIGSEILWIMDNKGIVSDSYKPRDDSVDIIYFNMWRGNDEGNNQAFNK